MRFELHAYDMSPFLVSISLILALVSGDFVQCCQLDPTFQPGLDPLAIAADNESFRLRRRDVTSSLSKTAIKNVQIFDGYRLLAPSTVVIDGSTIGVDARGAQEIDGTGFVLLPGLIDSHCHPENTTHLEDLSRYGVTTAFNMATFIPQLGESLKNQTGLTDIIVASAPASATGSVHGNITARIDPTLLIAGQYEAQAWLDRQLAWNPDFVKIVAENPGLDQSTLDLLTSRSHKRQKKVICHAATHDAVVQAMMAGVDQIHHSTLDRPVDNVVAGQILAKKQIVCPTLSIMKAIVAQRPSASYEAAREYTQLIHRTGIPIIAGTDANLQQGLMLEVPFGISMHEELELMIDAGMSNADVLRSATSAAADYWGLRDRGRVVPGLRADLLLIEGNPLKNIKATRNIKKVWLNGIEFDGRIG